MEKNDKKERLLKIIKNILSEEKNIIFAYAIGSFVKDESFRDIDIAIYVNKPEEDIFIITSDIKTKLSTTAKHQGLKFTADHFDVKIINDAPFTFFNRVFKEGLLLIDNNPDLRTDLIEYVSKKYRECGGILAEASSI